MPPASPANSGSRSAELRQSGPAFPAGAAGAPMNQIPGVNALPGSRVVEEDVEKLPKYGVDVKITPELDQVRGY